MSVVGQRQSFYGQIASNRRKSILLVLIVFALMAGVGFLIGFAVGGVVESGVVGVVVAVVVATLITSISYFSGDSLVLAASGAKQVAPQDAPQLMNVVTELSLAAGIPPPKVYVINDTAPNAFATGRDPQHASVAITTGLLQKLDREELQGVMAHELAHVRNLDIRFTLLVGALVGSIVLLTDFFLRFSFYGGMGRSRGRDSGGGGAGAILFVVALLLAIVAPFFARLVQLAVNREREYLADASSVELTRNPYGLQRALAKIAGDTEVLEVANRATQHLYIVNPIKRFEERSKGLMSTHPSVVDRINRLRSLSGEAPLDIGDREALARLG
ncbi:MAG: M48 family metallopeptidase [Chloroflexota bacterium]|nr:M48 family metallopeptidase [Chloroflexota bacterium]